MIWFSVVGGNSRGRMRCEFGVMAVTVGAFLISHEFALYTSAALYVYDRVGSRPGNLAREREKSKTVYEKYTLLCMVITN